LGEINTSAGSAGEHPEVVNQDAPGDHQLTVFKASAAKRGAEEFAFEDSDAAWVSPIEGKRMGVTGML